MLSVQELEDFAKDHVTSRNNLENYFIVASDDELARVYKDTVNPNNESTLVVVLPTYDPEILDEDNRRMKNNLYFMVVKKTDVKGGHDHKVELFKITQVEIKALLVKVLDLHHNFGEYCTFRDIDLGSISIDPVNDYVGANGWQIEFSTRSKF